MAAITPTMEDFQTAADWLDTNEGDGGEAEACSRVAEWLRKQADAKELRDMARAMSKFVTFDAVSVDINPLLSLFTMQDQRSASATSRAIRASDVTSYEPVVSYELPGRPNTRLTLSSGEVMYVKQHVTTVAELLRTSD